MATTVTTAKPHNPTTLDPFALIPGADGHDWEQPEQDPNCTCLVGRPCVCVAYSTDPLD